MQPESHMYVYTTVQKLSEMKFTNNPLFSDKQLTRILPAVTAAFHNIKHCSLSYPLDAFLNKYMNENL